MTSAPGSDTRCFFFFLLKPRPSPETIGAAIASELT